MTIQFFRTNSRVFSFKIGHLYNNVYGFRIVSEGMWSGYPLFEISMQRSNCAYCHFVDNSKSGKHAGCLNTKKIFFSNLMKFKIAFGYDEYGEYVHRITYR